jgi:HAD superfamily hydrolase (TIGR01509 family)
MSIKLVIFDLDGVLISTRTLHYEVLNQALLEEGKEYVISYQDHLLKFDGLSTSKKLDMLETERGLSKEAKERVWERKQKLTIPSLVSSIQEDKKIIQIINKLKQDSIKVYVASNSIEKSVMVSLNQLGILFLVDGYLSNESVSFPKPHPEIYWNCMTLVGVLPSETLIVEDSYIGRSAAVSSGANLCPVNNKDEVTMERINNHLNKEQMDLKWHDEKMNVLIPCAGHGSRFADAGYTFPKLLIDVNGKPMIQVVVENLNINANFIFIVRQEHYDTYNLKSLLNIIAPNCKIVTVNEVTEGACCTTLLAEKYIDNDNPLVIANSDQFMQWRSGEFYHSLNSDNIDGSIVCFENIHPKWSYVKTNEYGNVTEVAEKKVISNQATTGVYFYKKGSDYVKYSKQMIEKNIRTNNEFYVCPVFNEFIGDGKIIKTFTVDKMNGLGTPEDLNNYLNNNK